MNRLTKIVDGTVWTDRDAFSAIRKLAVYEDTGLSPGEVKQMKAELERYRKAETEGRFVELPCKVGDIVYDHAGREMIVDAVNIYRIGTSTFTATQTHDHWQTSTFYSFEDVGKIVFLTKEEVEAQKA